MLNSAIFDFVSLYMTADPSPKPRTRPWKTVLLVLGSATFGGIAFALWNRRELAQIHAERNAPESDSATAEQYDEEMFI